MACRCDDDTSRNGGIQESAEPLVSARRPHHSPSRKRDGHERVVASRPAIGTDRQGSVVPRSKADLGPEVARPATRPRATPGGRSAVGLARTSPRPRPHRQPTTGTHRTSRAGTSQMPQSSRVAARSAPPQPVRWPHGRQRDHGCAHQRDLAEPRSPPRRQARSARVGPVACDPQSRSFTFRETLPDVTALQRSEASLVP